ncbi:MAG: hypothetical protein V8S31_05630 [Lachnospiraceae bacterium]
MPEEEETGILPVFIRKNCYRKKSLLWRFLRIYRRALQDGEQSALFAQMKEEFQLLVQFVLT